MSLLLHLLLGAKVDGSGSRTHASFVVNFAARCLRPRTLSILAFPCFLDFFRNLCRADVPTTIFRLVVCVRWARCKLGDRFSGARYRWELCFYTAARPSCLLPYVALDRR